MNSHLLISPGNPGLYYGLFYIAAFLAGFVLLLWEGQKQEFPVLPWMLVIASAFLFFVFGCRLIAFTTEDWSYVLRLQALPQYGARSVLGGILLCVPGILLAKSCLGFKRKMLDSFALVLPVGIAIQRFGCLLAGCCYGSPSEWPWSIQYGLNSLPFRLQFHQGLLPVDAVHSLPVHPVQCYEVLSCLAIVLLVIRFRKKVKAPGNQLFLSILLYGVFRFFLEYFRAEDQASALALTSAQMGLVLFLPLLSGFMYYRERQSNEKGQEKETVETLYGRPSLYLLFLSLTFLLLSRWMSLEEVLSFLLVLLPLHMTMAWRLLLRVTASQVRMASLGLPMLAMLLMSQTLPEYSKSDSTKLSYDLISLGWTTGQSNYQSYFSSGGGSCTGPPPANYLAISTTGKNTNSAMGFGLSRTIQMTREKTVTFGMAGFWGSQQEVSRLDYTSASQKYTQNIQQQTSYYGVRPFFQVDKRKVGWSVGAQFGELYNIVYPDGRQVDLQSSVKKYSVYPTLSLRVGDLRRFFVEYKFSNQFPSSVPYLNHQFALGLGFGKKHPGNIRMGIGSQVDIFVSPSIPIGKHFVAEGFLGFGGPIRQLLIENSASGLMSNSVSSISLHYKFNRKLNYSTQAK